MNLGYGRKGTREPPRDIAAGESFRQIVKCMNISPRFFILVLSPYPRRYLKNIDIIWPPPTVGQGFADVIVEELLLTLRRQFPSELGG